MTLEATTRSIFYLDGILFPNGIPPGSLVEIKGASRSGKSFLAMYLLAKFVVSNPHKKAVFIDTASQLSLPSFFKILSNLLHLPKEDKNAQSESSWYYSQLESYLSRITIIRCFSSEDLLFCFGPKNAGRLEMLLLQDSDISVVFVDCLNSYSFCSSLNGANPVNFPDVFELLKRSVDSTKTPVIYLVSNVIRPFITPEAKSTNTENQQISIWACTAYDKPSFTHAIYLQRLKGNFPVLDSKGVTNQEFMCKISLLPKNNLKVHLSSLNQRLKFSIVSGCLKWLDPLN